MTKQHERQLDPGPQAAAVSATGANLNVGFSSLTHRRRPTRQIEWQNRVMVTPTHTQY